MLIHFKLLLLSFCCLFLLLNLGTPVYAAYSCNGTITDSKSSQPIPGVKITLQYTDNTSSSLTNNADGGYAYTGEKGIKSFVFEREGYQTFSKTALTNCPGNITLVANAGSVPIGPSSLCTGAVSLSEIPSCAQSADIATPKLHNACPDDKHAFSCDSPNARLCMNGTPSVQNVVCRGSSNTCQSLGIKITPDMYTYGKNQPIAVDFRIESSRLSQLNKQSKYVIEFLGKTGVAGGVNVGTTTLDPFRGDYSKTASQMILQGGLSSKDTYQLWFKETEKPAWFGDRTGYAYVCAGPQITIQEANTEKTGEKNFDADPSLINATTCTNGKSPDGKPCTNSSGQFCNPDSGDKDNNGKGILTAIGCVPTEPAALVGAILRIGTMAGGGIALLLMISGAFQMMTSAGVPDAVKKGREQFTSALIGLVFIIFSLALLQIIGVDILAIPGFK